MSITKKEFESAIVAIINKLKRVISSSSCTTLNTDEYPEDLCEKFIDENTLIEEIKKHMEKNSKWVDKNNRVIKKGDTLYHPLNAPTELKVLGDNEGNLYLGDMSTPFNKRFQFETYWEVV